MARVEPGAGTKYDFIELFHLMEEIQGEVNSQENRKVLNSVIEVLKNISLTSIKFQKWTSDPRELLYQLHGKLKQEEHQKWDLRILNLVKEDSRRKCVA
jgi:primosomal protein N''